MDGRQQQHLESSSAYNTHAAQSWSQRVWHEWRRCWWFYRQSGAGAFDEVVRTRRLPGYRSRPCLRYLSQPGDMGPWSRAGGDPETLYRRTIQTDALSLHRGRGDVAYWTSYCS